MTRAFFCLALLAALVGAFATDITGTWTFNVETEMGSGSPTFVFQQDGEKLAGTYSGLFGKADLTGTVKGDQIDFRFKTDVQGETMEIHYSGTVESPTRMKGKVDFGHMGSGTWTATKK